MFGWTGHGRAKRYSKWVCRMHISQVFIFNMSYIGKLSFHFFSTLLIHLLPFCFSVSTIYASASLIFSFHCIFGFVDVRDLGSLVIFLDLLMLSCSCSSPSIIGLFLGLRLGPTSSSISTFRCSSWFGLLLMFFSLLWGTVRANRLINKQSLLVCQN